MAVMRRIAGNNQRCMDFYMDLNPKHKFMILLVLPFFRNDKNDTVNCGPAYFLCDTICLPQSKLCDGKVDCYAFDDEANCTGK